MRHPKINEHRPIYRKVFVLNGRLLETDGKRIHVKPTKLQDGEYRDGIHSDLTEFGRYVFDLFDAHVKTARIGKAITILDRSVFQRGEPYVLSPELGVNSTYLREALNFVQGDPIVFFTNRDYEGILIEGSTRSAIVMPVRL